MTDVPEEWRAYARLQEKLRRRPQVDDYSWGLEHGLNRLLGEELADDEAAERAVRTGSRRERYQEQLRDIYLKVEEPAANLDDVVDARHRLHLVRTLVTPEDSALLRAIGEGAEYKEIGADKKTAPGALRARVLRLRRSLVALAS